MRKGRRPRLLSRLNPTRSLKTPTRFRCCPIPPLPPRRRHEPKEEPAHQETAKSDIDIGGFYLDQKNWRAALSRFQSALVLDPENPEVYWGLAEAQRHLGDFAKAKANYLKLLDYDPDSKHGKEAKKILDNPELANAPTASAAQPHP